METSRKEIRLGSGNSFARVSSAYLSDSVEI